MPTTTYHNKAGKRLSGVTTIISQNLGWNTGPLMHWAFVQGQEGKNYRETRDRAADAGTLCHAMIDADIKGTVLDLTGSSEEIRQKANTGLENFKAWKEAVKFTPLFTEIHLVSEVHQYGATPDCIGTIGGKLSLIDWKTSNGVYTEMLVQLAAYRVAWEENHPDEPLVGGYHLLRVSKASGAFHYHYWDTFALLPAWQVFEHLISLGRLKPNVKEQL
jgi:hypothetical protein